MTKLIKYVAFVKEILKGHMTGRRIPILVTLCVTNRCNIRCVYCYEEYYERNHKEFTTQELLDLIDELAEMGAKYISINGGEALLRKDIEIIIDKVNANNMLSHITSNGILVKKNISVLKKVDSMAISIDGNKESKAVLKQILDYKKKGLPIFFSYNSYRDALNWPFTYNRQTVFNELPDGYKNRDCYLKRFACQIEANGSVYPCVVLVNKIKALNFQEVGFKKAWKNLENCDCKLCYNICHNDLNNIFGLKPEVVWNAFKIVGKRLFHGSKSKKLN